MSNSNGVDTGAGDLLPFAEEAASISNVTKRGRGRPAGGKKPSRAVAVIVASKLVTVKAPGKRGRPPGGGEKKKGRGRPPASASVQKPAQRMSAAGPGPAPGAVKSPGRPKKVVAAPAAIVASTPKAAPAVSPPKVASAPKAGGTGRPRGRPRKA